MTVARGWQFFMHPGPTNMAALQGRVFRIGHMGDLSEPMLLGALSAIEVALADAGVPHARGNVDAPMDALRAPAAHRKAAVVA